MKDAPRLPGRATAGIVVLLALAPSACTRPAPVVVHDLVERVPVVSRQASREIVLFGTPAAEPFEAAGFFRWAGGKGDRFVWARKEVDVALRFGAVAERVAVVELQPFAGVRQQSVEVSLNGAAVAQLGLNDHRQRYLVPLPAEHQTAGENRLRFLFARTASAAQMDAASRDGGQLAAAFYSLVVGETADEGIEALLLRDAPRPFGIIEAEGAPSVVMWGGSGVAFALTLPEGAELRFRPRLHPASRTQGSAAEFVVTLESERDGVREMWRRTLGPREADPVEVAVRLPGGSGDVARLGLRLESGEGTRSGWGIWEAPRVVAPRSGAREEAARQAADELHHRLAGTNVLLVFLDAARASHLGCYGYSRATTPEIDRIASDGIVFERAYTPAVYTLGAMTAVWTSQQPDPHPGELSFASRLPGDRLTLAELVSGQGIHSAGFVANAMAGRALGFDRGFAEFHELFGDPELGSRAEVFRRVVPGFLARNRDRRFFAYLHYREPHFPYDPPPPFDSKFGSGGPLPEAAPRDRDWYVSVNRGATRPAAGEIEQLVRLYDGNLAYVDREIGALRRALEEAGLWDRTTLVIASDHGEQLFEHGYISHSGQVYEESVRVPLIVRLPGGLAPRGARIRELVSLADLAPTIADLMGVLGRGGSDQAFDGQSLVPAMLGGTGHPFVVSRTVWDRPVYALRDARFKYIRATASGSEELYELGSDPHERRNLAGSESLRLAYHREALDLWLSRLRGRRAGTGERALLSPEQCENMRSLGYVEGCK